MSHFNLMNQIQKGLHHFMQGCMLDWYWWRPTCYITFAYSFSCLMAVLGVQMGLKFLLSFFNQET